MMNLRVYSGFRFHGNMMNLGGGDSRLRFHGNMMNLRGDSRLRFHGNMMNLEEIVGWDFVDR
jgi:hypothetical protein